jgi:hypothetical protein
VRKGTRGACGGFTIVTARFMPNFGDPPTVEPRRKPEHPFWSSFWIEKRAAGMMAAFSRMNKDILKDKAYLERKDGKRLALLDYKPPVADNMGAKFVFERTLDGQPFVSADSDFVKFVVDVSERLKLNIRFRVASMTYGDKLEY